TVAEWSCGELFTALEEHQIPLLLPLSRVGGDFNAVHNIMKEHKELRVILTGVGYTTMRDVYPLLAMFPNLYISTSVYRGFEGIEDTVERFGANRLVFGSGMPSVSGASSVALLTYARISDEDKALIGSGNIKRLLSEVTF
ncbi:MAG: amidohydrolase family protein, partial [Oscillospiraceae bacterium]|nr:amidohydrolase family protein [Oscillospiraceae bacterium]